MCMIVACFAVLTTAEQVRSDDPAGDPVKQTLMDLMELACGIADMTEGLEGPVTHQVLKDELQISLMELGFLSEALLYDPASPLCSSLCTQAMRVPLDTSGMTLSGMTSEACELARQALEDYCASLESGDQRLMEGAAHALWQAADLCPAIMEAAGIE
jgi:hypothetical protein